MKKFFIDMSERAIKTFAQTAVATITGSAVMGIEEVGWIHVLSVSGLATIISILTSIASYNFSEKGTASLVNNPKEEG